MQPLVGRLESTGHANEVLGEWAGERGPGHYLRRQVKTSPLLGLGDLEAIEVLKALPDMLVFSSDYPHSEGNADPIALYGQQLDELPANIRADFMGATMTEVFERTGDPLPLMHGAAYAILPTILVHG